MFPPSTTAADLEPLLLARACAERTYEGVRSSPSKCFFHTYLTKDCWGPLGTAGDGWAVGWGRLEMLGTAGDCRL